MSGGPSYLKALKGPLPQIHMIPTGGVGLSNAADFFKAGASAIAVGSDLVSKKALADGDFDHIEKTAKQFLDIVKQARS